MKAKRISAVLALLALITAAPRVLASPVPVRTADESHAFSMDETREALRMPFDQRLAHLRQHSFAAMRHLNTIMRSASESMEMRWRATTALGRMGGAQARTAIEQALHSNEWYLRNAGLVSLTQTDRASAAQWARRLLSDKALLVRAAAVDTLATVRDSASANLLWQKLNARENFRGKQGLFIRRRIVETLAKIEAHGNEGKFVALLSDPDESLHEPAIEALERMTNQNFAGMPEAKRAQWQHWWKTQTASLGGKTKI